MINLLIVHEFPLMCSIIASVLDSEPDIKVLGCASSIDEAIDRVMKNDVNLVLISTRLPDQGTIRLTNLLVQQAPSVKVLILGITESRESVLQYVESGAAGYVLRESSLDDLLTTIRAVYSGQAFISPEIAATLIQRVSEFARVFSRTGVNPPESLSLTQRELEVAELLSENLSNQEISERLVIEVGTVKNHVHNILNKLGVSSREDAANLMLVLKERSKGQN
jgi:two-component system NarL family response regulator